MGVELLEVRDFLAQHAPFDTLPPAALDQVPRQCTLRYARRGTVVLDVGARGEGLYVVRSGAVDVVDEAGGLVERVGTGVAFGMSSLLERRPTRYRCTATEDTLLLVLPLELFETLAREHTGFASFYAATHHDRLSRAIGNLQQAASGSTVLGTPVADLVTHEPVATAPGATIEEAADAMSQGGVSCILVVDEGGLTGIVTDRDLRNRVLAVGLDPRRPVRGGDDLAGAHPAQGGCRVRGAARDGEPQHPPPAGRRRTRHGGGSGVHHRPGRGWRTPTRSTLRPTSDGRRPWPRWSSRRAGSQRCWSSWSTRTCPRSKSAGW